MGICESIVGCSPPALLDRRAVLQRVGLELPPGLQGSSPMSPSTPTLPPSPWSSPPGSPATPTPSSDLLGSPQPLLTTRLVSPLCPNAPSASGLPSLLLKPPSRPPQGFEITSTSSCLHFVSATTSEVSGGLPLPVCYPLSLSHPMGNIPQPWDPVNLLGP